MSGSLGTSACYVRVSSGLGGMDSMGGGVHDGEIRVGLFDLSVCSYGGVGVDHHSLCMFGGGGNWWCRHGYSWIGLDLMVGGDDRDMLRWFACPKAVNFGVA